MSSTHLQRTDDLATGPYFDAVADLFSVASRIRPSEELWLETGGARILLRTLGFARFQPLLEALSHLTIDRSHNPDLTIHLWDAASTSCLAPRLPWDIAQLPARGGAAELPGDRYGGAIDTGTGVISVWDRSARLAFYCARDATALPFYERSAPARAILNRFFCDRDQHMVHAGAVGTGGGAALVAGPSGSGKSTVCLSCLINGLDFLGDEYILIDRDRVRAWSLYSTAKLEPDHASRLSTLSSWDGCPGRITGQKALYNLQLLAPDGLRRGLPLRVLLVPRVRDAIDTTVHPISAAEALRAFAPSSIMQLLGAGSTALKAMATLARRLPCYQLELGSDLDQIPNVVRSLLEQR